MGLHGAHRLQGSSCSGRSTPDVWAAHNFRGGLVRAAGVGPAGKVLSKAQVGSRWNRRFRRPYGYSNKPLLEQLAPAQFTTWTTGRSYTTDKSRTHSK